MRRDIIEIGHPGLRRTADPIPDEEIASDWVQILVDDLIETKRAANGAGIAAPQISEPWRIFVVEIGESSRYPYRPRIPLNVLINPELTFNTDERITSYEGCLSVPNLRGLVARCPDIRVRGTDRNGFKVDFTVKGISAVAFQHEHDHLDGILYTDILNNPHSLCTATEFDARYEEDFRKSVIQIVAEYGS